MNNSEERRNNHEDQHLMIRGAGSSGRGAVEATGATSFVVCSCNSNCSNNNNDDTLSFNNKTKRHSTRSTQDESSDSDHDGDPHQDATEVALLQEEALVDVNATAADSSPSEAFMRRRMNRGSWKSNIFFLLGSILYVWVASWDLWDERFWDEEYDDDGDSETSSPSFSASLAPIEDMSSVSSSRLNLLVSAIADAISPYMLLSGAAALCYVLDAAVQIVQLAMVASNTTPSNESAFRISSHHLLHNVRFWIVEVLVGITFGLGALLDLASTCTSNLENDNWSNGLAIAAVHVYLLNAILLLSSKPWPKDDMTSSCCSTNRLEGIGDVLFAIGSVLDVALSYSYNDRTSDAMWKVVDRGSLVSAILWLVDAMLYITADCLEERTRRRPEDNSDDDESPPGSQDQSV